MIPTKKKLPAELRSTWYEDGLIFNEYKVIVPDRNYGGDVRFEWVVTVHKTMETSDHA